MTENNQFSIDFQKKIQAVISETIADTKVKITPFHLLEMITSFETFYVASIFTFLSCCIRTEKKEMIESFIKNCLDDLATQINKSLMMFDREKPKH